MSTQEINEELLSRIEGLREDYYKLQKKNELLETSRKKHEISRNRMLERADELEQ
jgi:hypothetical protein